MNAIRFRVFGQEENAYLEIAHRDYAQTFLVECVRERQWIYLPHRTVTGWDPGRVSPAAIEKIGGLLDGLLLRRGPQRGRQVTNAPDKTLFVLRWPAPFHWDDALADHPVDLRLILQGLTEAASEYRIEPAIGLWVESFSRTSGEVILNNHAEALVGRSRITRPESWNRPCT